jgi:hypothetical protein
MLPLGEAFNQAPPETVIEAVSAPPVVIRTTACGSGAAPPVT